MRLKEIGAAQRRLLAELAGRVSNRLEATFTELAAPDGPNIGLSLHERGRKVVLELPGDLLIGAGDDLVARELLRVRIKAARDRMLFRPPPPSLPKRIAAAEEVGNFRSGFGRGHGPGRGRR
ncbi:MAG: hypothetical protein U0807_00940 [Candidatus Binatia bacterium]